MLSFTARRSLLSPLTHVSVLVLSPLELAVVPTLICAEAVRRCEVDAEGDTITRRDLKRKILELTNDF